MTETETATRIFRAGRVISMRGEAAEAFAVGGGRVLSLGTAADLRDRYGGAEVVDLGAGVVVPGFNDAHMHLVVAAEDLLHLDPWSPPTPSTRSSTASAGRRGCSTPPASRRSVTRSSDPTTWPCSGRPSGGVSSR